MNRISRLSDIPASLRRQGRRVRIAVVCGTDRSTLHAVCRAVEEGFADAVMVGNEAETRREAQRFAIPTDGWRFVRAESPEEAARRAVACVRAGEADVVMKGLIGTSTLLRAMLDKENGLLPKDTVMSHVAVSETGGRLLLYSDVAVIPNPTRRQRMAIVGYLADTCRAFGIEVPRIALIHCSETVSEHFPHTLDYAPIKEEAEKGKWGKVIVDGPLDLRTSIDAEALKTKGILSPLEGRADAIVFPDIEAGNVFYKTATYLLEAPTAGILVGTVAPVVLPSRGDSENDKFLSLALAALKHSHTCKFL